MFRHFQAQINLIKNTPPMERLKTFVFILLKASSFFGGRGEGSCILSRVNVYICLGLDDDYFSFHTMVRFVFVIPDMMLQAGSAGWERKGKKKRILYGT